MVKIHSGELLEIDEAVKKWSDMYESNRAYIARSKFQLEDSIFQQGNILATRIMKALHYKELGYTHVLFNGDDMKPINKSYQIII